MNIRFLLLFFLITIAEITLSQQSFVLPKDGQTQDTKTVNFLWNKNAYSDSYKLQISTSATFSSIVLSTATSNNYLTLTLTNYGIYYCRVKGNNDVSWSPIVKIELIDFGNDNNLISWFDASTNVTYTDSTVSQWKDRKSTARAATQGTLSKQPVVYNNLSKLNNKSTISFNGNSSNPTTFNINPAITTEKFTLFCLRNYRNNANLVQFFLCGNGHGFSSEVDAANGGFSVSGLNGSVIIAPLSALRTEYSIYCITDSSFSVNTNRVPIAQTSGSSFVSQMSLTQFGSRPEAPNLAYQGEIAEVLMFDSIIDVNKRNTVTAYLRTKYSPPVNLGLDTIAGSSFTDTIRLSTRSSFARYQWSTGDTTQTIKVTTAGTYKVRTTDIFGFVSEDEIEVYPYRRLKSTNVNLCPGDSVIVNLGLDSSYSILWSTGATTSSVVFRTSGQYKVSITKNTKTILDTINVVLVTNVDTTSLVYSPARDQNQLVRICGGGKIYIKNDSLFDSFIWSTGSTQNYGTAYNTGDVYINYIERNGCKLVDTLAVVVTGQVPVANFTTTAICQNSSASFSDLSQAPAGNTITRWKWNFSNGDTSNVQNPLEVFSSTGAASAALRVTTDAGCSDSIFKTFTVNRNPKAKFDNRLSCEATATNFQDLSIANAASIIDWRWDFNGLGAINSIQNPSFIFPAAGNYNVQLVVKNSNQCEDSVTNIVTVNPSPLANFSFDSICGRNDVHFKWLSSVAPPADIQVWNWDFGDGTFNSAIKDVSHPYDTPGEYDVILTVRSTNVCSDTAIRRVKVFEYPTIDFDVSPTQCVGKEIQFTDISTTPDNNTPISSWNWYFSGQTTSNLQNPRYVFDAAGNYTIQLTAANSIGCSGTKLRSIAVSPPPIPKFSFSPQNGLPPLTVNYTNLSTASGNYFWDYGDNTGPLVQAFTPPSHTYTTIGSYPIKLIATDFRGCTDTLIKYILVDKAYLDGVMATVTVTPNGDFYKVQALILNNSNVEIRSLGLSLQLGGGSVVRENWEGSLLPGQSVAYAFASQIRLSDVSLPVICAAIENINNYTPEDRTDNNSACKEVKVGTFDVLNIFPNPAKEYINFGVMLPQEGTVSVGFVDYLGRELYKTTFNGLKGYNNFTVSTATLNAAVYLAVIKYDGEIIRKKFVCRGIGN